MLVLLMCALGSPAWAGAVVVYEGDVGAEYRAAVRDAGLDPWEVRAVRFSELGAGAGPAVWTAAGGRYAPVPAAACSRAEKNADLREQVRIAEGHVNYRRYGEAGAALERAAERLGCLDEPAEASLAGRIAFLRGVVRAQAGDREGAVAAFAEARAWQPDLRWPDEFDPALRAAFDAAGRPAGEGGRPAGEGGRLRLGPGAGQGEALWIDGRRPSVAGGAVTLPAGRHLVQVLAADRAWTWAVDGGADLLVVDPGGFSAGELARATEPAGEAVYAAAIRAAVGRGTDVYLRSGGSTWRVAADGVQRLPAAAGSAGGACPVPRRCVARGLVGAGATAVVVGGGVAAWSAASIAAHAGDLHDFELVDPGGENSAALVTAYADDLNRSQGERAAMQWAGVGVAGAGAVTLVLGLVLDHQRPGDELARAPRVGVVAGDHAAALVVGGAW